jgi:hypothetical protein
LGNLKSLASGKTYGVAVGVEKIVTGGAQKSPIDIDNFLQGLSYSAGYYDMVGVGVSHNSSGTAVEMGFGLGGVLLECLTPDV